MTKLDKVIVIAKIIQRQLPRVVAEKAISIAYEIVDTMSQPRTKMEKK